MNVGIGFILMSLIHIAELPQNAEKKNGYKSIRNKAFY